MTTPRLFSLLTRIKGTATGFELRRKARITHETIESVRLDGRYTILGYDLATTGTRIFQLGEVVPVLWQAAAGQTEAVPTVILAHSWRRAQGILPAEEVVAGDVQTLEIVIENQEIFLVLTSATQGDFAINLTSDFGVSLLDMTGLPGAKFCQGSSSLILVHSGLKNLPPGEPEDQVFVLLLRLSRAEGQSKIPSIKDELLNVLGKDLPKLRMTEFNRFTRRTSDIILRKLNIQAEIQDTFYLARVTGNIPGGVDTVDLPVTVELKTNTTPVAQSFNYGITHDPSEVFCLVDDQGSPKVFALYTVDNQPVTDKLTRGLEAFSNELSLENTVLDDVNHLRPGIEFTPVNFSFEQEPFLPGGFLQLSPASKDVIATLIDVPETLVQAQFTRFETGIEPPNISSIGLGPGAGGVWPSTGVRFYRVTAVNATGEETNGSAEVFVDVNDTTKKVLMSWPDIPQALFYRVYRSEVSGVYPDPSVRLGVFSQLGQTIFFDDDGGPVSAGALPAENETTVGGVGTPWGSAFPIAPLYLVNLTDSEVVHRSIEAETTLEWTFFKGLQREFDNITVEPDTRLVSFFSFFISFIGNTEPAVKTFTGLDFSQPPNAYVSEPWTTEASDLILNLSLNLASFEIDRTTGPGVTGGRIFERNSVPGAGVGFVFLNLTGTTPTFGRLEKSPLIITTTLYEKPSRLEMLGGSAFAPKVTTILIPPIGPKNIADWVGQSFDSLLTAAAQFNFIRINERWVVLNIDGKSTLLDRINLNALTVAAESVAKFDFTTSALLISPNRFYFTPENQGLVRISLNAEGEVVLTSVSKFLKQLASFPIIVGDTSLVFPTKLETKGVTF